MIEFIREVKLSDRITYIYNLNQKVKLLDRINPVKYIIIDENLANGKIELHAGYYLGGKHRRKCSVKHFDSIEESLEYVRSKMK